jgi:hypothetical protein
MISRFMADARQWAQATFGGNTLPDERLSDRLIMYAEAQARNPSGSTAEVTSHDRAAQEGAYRFLENPRVLPEDIEQGAFEQTSELCRDVGRILLVQDTSSVDVASQELREQLISAGSPTGFLVHSCLAVDGTTGETLGLLDQQRWIRQKAAAKDIQAKRDYSQKESAKWAVCDMAARGRLANTEGCITVCDREADIFEFLLHHVDRGERFIVRARADRRLSKESTLFATVRAAPVVGTRSIRIEQRGGQVEKIPQKGRPARQRRDTVVNLHAVPVVLPEPSDRKVPGSRPLSVNVVRVFEEGGDSEWILLTTEAIDSLEDIDRIVRDYESRWLIEEFHKWWKTGCRLESRPLQSLGAIERMMVITAPIAIRLMHLHNAVRSDEVDKTATPTLSMEELRCLWAITERKSFPRNTPTVKWAYGAIARLGGFYDSKRTGRVGCQTLWKGWLKFQERFDGWLAARALVAGAKM